jgi:hypothetical protein
MFKERDAADYLDDIQSRTLEREVDDREDGTNG